MDQKTGARAGGYFSDSKSVDTSEALRPEAEAVYDPSLRQNFHEVIDLSQEESNPATVFTSISQTWTDSSPGNTDPVIKARSALRAAQAVYELTTTQNPQEVVDLSQEESTQAATPFKSMPQTWSNLYRANTDPVNSWKLLVAENGGGSLHERNDRVQSFGEEELSARNASRHGIQEIADKSWLGNRRVLLMFPEGEADAVTISEQDMKGLQPTGFLSDNIVDFYIRYLERSLPLEERERFHFFNSFFFRKLLENSSASTGMNQCQDDFERVRKWTGAVNLFEKEYIFVPVLRSGHWSLIIICHLDSLWGSPDKMKGSACVFHLDSMKGSHESFEDQVRRYILQAWIERYQPADNMNQFLALCEMKYVEVEVPQQNNSYDCGVYLLHYVEEFLLKSTSTDFKFASSEEVLHFTSPHFDKRLFIQTLICELDRKFQEQAVKRTEIQSLTHELIQISHKLSLRLGEATPQGGFGGVRSNGASLFNGLGDGSNHTVQLSIGEIPEQNCATNDLVDGGPQASLELASDQNLPDDVEIARAEHQATSEVRLDGHAQEEVTRKPRGGVIRQASKVTDRRKLKDEETSILLECKAEGNRFSKAGNQGATRWDVISEEIESRLGTKVSADQCRLRYDTLLKAYKTIKNYCTKNGLQFSVITKAQMLEMKLATTLSEKWYEAIDEICKRRPPRSKSRKRVKLSSASDGNGPFSLGPGNQATQRQPPPPGAPISTRAARVPTSGFEPESSPNRQVAIPGFSSLDKDLRCTLLNLVRASTFSNWEDGGKKREDLFELEFICERLAVVQDRKPEDIREHVKRLSDLKLVKVELKAEGEVWIPYYFGGGRSCSVVACLNLTDARVYRKFVGKVLCKNPDLKVFLEMCDDEEFRSFPIAPAMGLQRIRVLTLASCEKLERVDLNNFPELRSLVITDCSELEVITGWEVVTGLGWLDISECYSYGDFPPVQWLPNLRNFQFDCCISEMDAVPYFSKCVWLRRLEIGVLDSDVRSMDFSPLRFPQVLILRGYRGLNAIQGLGGLQSLTRLELTHCRALREVPELGCLKALTQLDLSRSGVEEVAGLQELHLLTHLDLGGCGSLRGLPWVGHLRALVELRVSWSGVEEIPGVEHLVSLEWLYCWRSRLKKLPELHHLPRLRKVDVGGTPVSEDRMSVYYGKREAEFGGEEGRMELDDDISDISDT